MDHSTPGTQPPVHAGAARVPTSPQRVFASRLPRWAIGLVIGAAALSVAVVATLLVWPDDESQPGPAGPLAFGPPEQVGRIAYEQPAPSQIWTRAIGDQLFVWWQERGSLTLLASGLADGSEHWRRQLAGPEVREIFTASSAVVAVVGPDPDTELYQIYVMNAADGQILWQRDTAVPHGGGASTDRLVWQDLDQRLYGFDLTTGRELWSYQLPEFAIWLSPSTEEDLSRSTDEQLLHLSGRNLSIVGYRIGERLIVLDQEGGPWRVLDSRDGAVISESGTPDLASIHPRLPVLSYQDRLYLVVNDDSGYEVQSYDLDDLTGTPSVHYKAEPQREAEDWYLCGQARLCLIESEEPGQSTRQLVLLDVTGDGEEMWREPIQSYGHVMPVGPWVIVTDPSAVNVERGPPVLAFDADGRRVLEETGWPIRVDSGNILLLDIRPMSNALSTSEAFGLSAVGIPATGGPPVDLGIIMSTDDMDLDIEANCTSTSIYLACPQAEGIVIWRFAERR